MQAITQLRRGNAWVKCGGVLLPIGGLVQKRFGHHLLPCVRSQAIMGQQHA
jgi:hypothetical protein